jgi:hypothetical protein
VRVRDDAERERAKDFEAKAVRFLTAAGLFDPAFCSHLSQTRLDARPAPAAARPAPSVAYLPGHF